MSKLSFTHDILKATMRQAKQVNAQSIHISGLGFDLKMDFFREAADTSLTTISSPDVTVNSLLDIYRNPPKEAHLEGDEYLTAEQKEEMEALDREILSITDPLAFENAIIDEHMKGSV